MTGGVVGGVVDFSAAAGVFTFSDSVMGEGDFWPVCFGAGVECGAVTSEGISFAAAGMYFVSGEEQEHGHKQVDGASCVFAGADGGLGKGAKTGAIGACDAGAEGVSVFAGTAGIDCFSRSSGGGTIFGWTGIAN